MAGGVILAEKATGDIYFIDESGKEVLPHSADVEIPIKRTFGGLCVEDALDEARRYAIGALKNKMQQKIRGKSCSIVPRNIDVDYTIKYGFGR